MVRYLDPKNDFVFKKIFGQHQHLLISFLNSLLTFEDGSIIESLEYLKDEMIPDNPAKKRSVVDVCCKDNNGRQFIVEMQMEWGTPFSSGCSTTQPISIHGNLKTDITKRKPPASQRRTFFSNLFII